MRPLLALVALALLSAGCLGAGDSPVPIDPQSDVETSDASLRELRETFEGSVSGTPIAPGAQEHKIVVPQGAVGVNGTLTWTAPLARVKLELLDPYGEVVDTGYPAQDGMLIVATVEPPASGEWTYRVIGESPVPVAYSLEGVAELLVPADNEVVKTVQIRSGAGFYEVNVIMEENATFTFGFNSTQPVNWDVHSHPPEGVKYWDQGRGTTASGSFTAPARGIYSLLFHNDGALPADVTFEMRGAFRLHSHAQ